jgi:hypothetical protein
MNNIEESIKLAKETKFAVLGRALADGIKRGENTSAIRQELQVIRLQEQESTSVETRFAALARQVGDADRNGKDASKLIAALVVLRRRELGPASPIKNHR